MLELCFIRMESREREVVYCVWIGMIEWNSAESLLSQQSCDRFDEEERENIESIHLIKKNSQN